MTAPSLTNLRKRLTQGSWGSSRSVTSFSSKRSTISTCSRSTVSTAVSSRKRELPKTSSTKKVRFARKIRVLPIPSCNSMSEDAKNEIWYSKQERDEIKEAVGHDLVDRVESGRVYAIGVNETYRTCRFLGLTAGRNPVKKLQDPNAVKKYAKNLLEARQALGNSSCSESFRGLEDWVMTPLLRKGKFASAKQVVSRAVDTTKYSRTRRVPMVTLSESLAKECCDLSLCSTFLARVYAEVDALDAIAA